jgi:hypothetical protein
MVACTTTTTTTTTDNLVRANPIPALFSKSSPEGARARVLGGFSLDLRVGDPRVDLRKLIHNRNQVWVNLHSTNNRARKWFGEWGRCVSQFERWLTIEKRSGGTYTAQHGREIGWMECIYELIHS